MFCKKCVLKSLAKFTGKPVCQSLFFDKVATENKTPAQAFSCEYCKIVKNSFFYRIPPVVASCKIRTKSLKLEKFKFHLFLTTIDITGSLYIVT